jgi:DNA-directed RNA polymerase specialized sigma24 family protein
MSVAGSVTGWIAQLKTGDQAAAQLLWERYYSQLVVRARRKLARRSRRAADEEDVVLSAFVCFCDGAKQGRFPKLNDRHDVWQILVMISERKAINLFHSENRAKRGGGRLVDEEALPECGSLSGGAPLNRVEGREPSPEFAAQVAEECGRLLNALGDGELKRIAVEKMEGYTVKEIAARTGLLPRTVQRRLRLIRRMWKQELEP